MHAFDLSHPNLLAFIDRAFGNISHNRIFQLIYKFFCYSPLLLWLFVIAVFAVYIAGCAYCIYHYLTYRFCEINFYFAIFALLSLAGIGGLVWVSCKLKKLNGKKFNHFFNCLSVLENPLEYQFLMLEYFLKDNKRNKENLLIVNNKLKIGKDCFYDKIVLCPLIMDFGKKNLDKNDVFYNLSPQKPVVKQVEDLLNASRIYREKIVVEAKDSVLWKDQSSADDEEKKRFDEKLFEIYPFIGLNTNNYSYAQLETMFDKYFEGYEHDTKEDRMNKLHKNAGKFGGDIYDPKEKFTYYFAGIKVYPPLGFNPMPVEDEALEKVRLLYKTAEKKRIPIITHCSDGGFTVHKKAEDYTNPKAWSNVLKDYSQLKLCFAHFGHQRKNKKEWQETIICLIKNYENVYADISCCAGDKKYYDDLLKLLCEHPQLESRILFGSDFLINLITGERSYNFYLANFGKYFANKFTHRLCSENPEAFLFGK